MYITKFMLDHPTTTLYEIDPVMYERARKIYEHFEKNDLFFVDGDRKEGHVFFDGKYTVEITKQWVKFKEDVNPRLFTAVDYNGEALVRYNRTLKPAIYHPIMEEGFELRKGSLSDAEKHLLSKYCGLSKFCLYNRVHGWTVDICDNVYPLVPSMSLSIHAVKMQNWFKAQFANICNVETKCYGKRVSTVRFFC